MSTDTRRRISCLRFAGLPPPPSAPCSDPTPDELFELVMAEQRHMSGSRREAEAAKAGPGGSGAAGAAAAEQGAFSKIASFVSASASRTVNAVDAFANTTHEATERKLRALERERGQNAFNLNFGALAAENFVVS